MKITDGSPLVTVADANGRTRAPRLFLRLVSLGFLLVMMAVVPGAQGAVDMFLEADGIRGEAQDEEFGEGRAIDVLAWSWGMTQSGTSHAGGGGGAGKATFQDLSITKYVDTATTALMQDLAKGSHIKEVKLTLRRPGAARQHFLVITMKEVLVTSLSTGGSAGGDRLTENVTFNFGEFKVEYLSPDGKTSTRFGWDIAQNAEK